MRVAVVHPVESYWLYWGPLFSSAAIRGEQENRFQSITRWLLLGGIDFDFISESLFPEQCREAGAPLAVGEMSYDAVIVPACKTLRGSTLKRLSAFSEKGGRLIFAGACPDMVDAAPSDAVRALYEKSTTVPFEHNAVLDALEPYRLVEFRNQDGTRTDNLIHQLREDGETLWLFVAHGV